MSIDNMEESSVVEKGRGNEEVVEEVGEVREEIVRMMKEESSKSIEVEEVGEK